MLEIASHKITESTFQYAIKKYNFCVRTNDTHSSKHTRILELLKEIINEICCSPFAAASA